MIAKYLRKTALAILAPMAVLASHAQENRSFRLDGGNVTYAMGVNSRGELQSVYWGPRLATSDGLPEPKPIGFADEINDTEQEFPGWGGGVLDEPALKISFPDGNRDLVLHYVSHTMAGDELRVRLRDISRDIFVTLKYSMDKETGILARSAIIENHTASKVMVEQAQAATWNFPARTDYSLRYLSGRWGGSSSCRRRRFCQGRLCSKAGEDQLGINRVPGSP